MNYNQFSKPWVNFDLPINSRAKLDTGTHCNYRCGFCYYKEALDVKTDLGTILKRIDKIHSAGIREIDLSGGESSIHDGWFDILEYCRERFESVSTLSNGHKFSSYDFIAKSKEAGLSEILFSLHGYDSDSHAKMVGIPNSFEKMLKAIENAKEVGIKVRLNCTVTRDNVDHLDEYAALVNRINPTQINFLPLNYWDDAGKVESEQYEELSEGIKKAIDSISADVQINVRYIPFCFMEGYEQYVVGIYQHIYDLNDWNIVAYGEFKDADIGIDSCFDEAHNKRMQSYCKPKECFTCKYFDICDGIEHKVKDTQKIYPTNGEKIKDPMFFRKNHGRV